MRAIREACGLILQREEPSALTTQNIAEVAGVNIASLYQYFPNKDAILADYFEHEATRIAEHAAALFELIDRLSRKSLEHTLAAIVELELSQRRALTRMNPEFFARYPQGVDIHHKVEALTRARENPDWATWLPRFLEQHQQKLRIRDTQRLAGICQAALRGVNSLSSPAAWEDDDPVTAKVETLALLLRYLLDKPPTTEACRVLFEEIDTLHSM